MIPNIVKGKGISGAIAYAMGEGYDDKKKPGVAYVAERAAGKGRGEPYILAEGELSRAEIVGGQNFGFEIDSTERVELARRMMEWNGMAENQASRGILCEKDCLHASLSWEKGLEPGQDEMREAAAGFLKSLGMEKAQAVFIAHNDTEHRHLHIIASRIDPTTGKTFSQADDFAKSQAWGLRWEREHDQIPQNESRQALHKVAAAIEARDGAAVVEHLTARTPTFTARELDKVLMYGGLGKEDRAVFRAEILADKNVIGLRETQDAPVSRYTTRDVLASEMKLLRAAKQLGDDHSHGVSETRLNETAAAHTLTAEQGRALDHLAGPEGFAVLWGEAGTGKSHTLKAVRSAYEAEGKSVWGLSHTNDVVQQMRGDGFRQAETITSMLYALEDGKVAWGKNTVVIVDEAAMVSTDQLGRLAIAARDAGAKLILAGDDAQLPSIERGGTFETLRQQHGAAILTEVMRVQEKEQKTAFNRMHEGDFREALATFDKAGGVHWTDKQADALKQMADRYAEDVAADPSKRRFMFAFTNAEVGELNQHARQIERDAGRLGDDHTLATKHGNQVFAEGDRIQFTGNGYGKRAKNLGLTNGRVGTITAMEFEGDFLIPRLTVTLDTPKGQPAQQVSFIVGADGKAGEFNDFRHGYAGTIYRGQGKTLDETYVLHSAQWRAAAAYVALTRHREAVHIFASRETIKGMERSSRASFDRVAEQTTLEAADLATAEKNHALDVMARGLARPENKRAATAYHIDDQSALRIDFDDVAKATAGVDVDPALSLRGFDRVRAFLEAQRSRQTPEAAPGEALDATEAQQPPDTATRYAERMAAFLAAEERDRDEDDATALLRRILGREVTAEDLADVQLVADYLRGARRDQDAATQLLQELARQIGHEVTAEEAAAMPAGASEAKTPAQRDQEAVLQALQELGKAIGREITGEEGSQLSAGGSVRERGGGQSL